MHRSLHTDAPLGAALLLALQLAPGSAAAAEEQAPVDPPTVQLQRIEVTGSAIRRGDAETAVPISVLRAEELRQQGVTSTEELIGRLSGNQGVYNSSRSVGSATGGASFADLRGIGANKTLVLLNGRRLANNAIDGSAVDLNTIPFAAIDRVEVLRDGASALYGTDVHRRGDQLHHPQEPERRPLRQRLRLPTHDGGGNQRNVSASWGFGELEEDRFNVFAVANYDKQERLGAKDRGYTYNYQPGRGLDYSSGTAFPGNWSQGASASNPLVAGGCKGADLIPRNGICRQSLVALPRPGAGNREDLGVQPRHRQAGRRAQRQPGVLLVAQRQRYPGRPRDPHRPADRSRHRLLSRQRHHSRSRRLRPRPEPAGGGQLAAERARAAPAILAEHRPAPAARLRRPVRRLGLRYRRLVQPEQGGRPYPQRLRR